MGYTTNFYGTVYFNKPVAPELKEFINKFSHNRHMTRDPELIKKMDPNWKQHCFNGNLGPNGIYYYPPEKIPEDKISRKMSWEKPAENKMINNMFGQLVDISVTADSPAEGVPGYWCQWVINDDDELEWDGSEKFYAYDRWMEFLIKHFFAPEGYVLNGAIDFQGEDQYDRGTMYVSDNVVTMDYYNQ